MKLKRKVRRLADKYPGLVDVGRLDDIQTMTAFTKQIATPLCRFADVADYYASGDCVNSIKRVSRPLLMVNALNDPFLTGECYPVEVANDCALFHLEMPRSGGHAAFPVSRTETWVAARVERFISEL